MSDESGKGHSIVNSIAIIIQARMSSTRLPGKSMAMVEGHPLLWYVVERCKASSADVVAVATSVDPTDDPIEGFCRQQNVPCMRGNLEDVLDRYYQAARKLGAETVVRVTGDCPLIDPQIIDQVIARFRHGDVDYVSNTIERRFPDGLDCEVCSLAALDRAWREATLKSEREHVTPYLYKHPERFRLGGVRAERDLSAMRWTVDEARDLEFLRAVVHRLGPDCRMNDIVELLEKEPELMRLNAGIQANEGYLKSVREDAAGAQ